MLKKMLLVSLFVPALVLATDPASTTSSSSASTGSTTSTAKKNEVVDQAKKDETKPLVENKEAGSEAGKPEDKKEEKGVKAWFDKHKLPVGIASSLGIVAIIAGVVYQYKKRHNQENSTN